MTLLLADYKIRVIGNACITRYERGEKDIYAVVNSYTLTEENKALVIKHISSTRPDIIPTTEQ